MTILTAIVTEIMSSTNANPTDIPPLYETIDPEMLAKFVDSVEDETATIEFTYCGHEVTVRGDGEITVDDRTGPSLRN